MTWKAVVPSLALAGSALGQTPVPPPIIDMHLHASSIAAFSGLLGGKTPIPHCVPMTDYPVPANGQAWPQSFANPGDACRSIMSPTSDSALMRRTLGIMDRRNVIGVVSGQGVPVWVRAAPSRFVAAMDPVDGPRLLPTDSLRAWFAAKRFAAFSEVAVQYAGMTPDDPALRPMWALAEELEIPVGIHIGTGPVGAPFVPPFRNYRARLHSPLLLEEVLVRHPRLRVWIMHAGWPMLDDLLAMMWTYPQLHVDVGVLDWALPRKEFHRYLQRIVEAGFGKRVMFGSDNMVWPDAIEIAIESIETASFLSEQQKRDILYNNAARFLRLSPQEIARHHGRMIP